MRKLAIATILVPTLVVASMASAAPSDLRLTTAAGLDPQPAVGGAQFGFQVLDTLLRYKASRFSDDDYRGLQNYNGLLDLYKVWASELRMKIAPIMAIENFNQIDQTIDWIKTNQPNLFGVVESNLNSVYLKDDMTKLPSAAEVCEIFILETAVMVRLAANGHKQAAEKSLGEIAELSRVFSSAMKWTWTSSRDRMEFFRRLLSAGLALGLEKVPKNAKVDSQLAKEMISHGLDRLQERSLFRTAHRAGKKWNRSYRSSTVSMGALTGVWGLIGGGFVYLVGVWIQNNFVSYYDGHSVSLAELAASAGAMAVISGLGGSVYDYWEYPWPRRRLSTGSSKAIGAAARCIQGLLGEDGPP